MTTLLTGEVDSVFLKAIFLLHSKSADSAQLLQDLLHDYKEKTYGFSKVKNEILDENKMKILDLASETDDKIDLSIAINNVEEVTSNNDDIKESFSKVEESVIEEIASASSFEPSLKKRMIDPTEISQSSDFSFNEEFSLDEIMDFSEPLCNVCYKRQYGEEDNSIVQCSECQVHYHQKCHKPIVSTKDMNDPRLIWYCSNCTKQIKKEMVAHQQVSLVKPLADNQVSNQKSSKSVNQSQPFRRPVTLTDSKFVNLK